MKREVIAVFDRAADAFAQPLFVNALGQGIRMFQDEINRAAQDNPMHHHADDFDLYHLGTWDDSQGKFDNLHEPKQIAIGKQLKTNGG